MLLLLVLLDVPTLQSWNLSIEPIDKDSLPIHKLEGMPLLNLLLCSKSQGFTDFTLTPTLICGCCASVGGDGRSVVAVHDSV